MESRTSRGILTAGCKITVRLDKDFVGDINPAVWNPPASAGGGMRCNPREVALL
jgi:hypothetical protein